MSFPKGAFGFRKSPSVSLAFPNLFPSTGNSESTDSYPGGFPHDERPLLSEKTSLIAEKTSLAAMNSAGYVAVVKSPVKKLSNGKVTTVLGGRPKDPSQRQATQAEVVRLRGMESMTFQAIGVRLGISDRQAHILWNEYWEKEHSLSAESAEAVRSNILTRLRLLRDTALALATNSKVKVSKEDPNGGTIDLADFEKVAKMGKLALGCMIEEAKLCAAYGKADGDEQPGILSILEFSRLAVEHMNSRREVAGESCG